MIIVYQIGLYSFGYTGMRDLRVQFVRFPRIGMVLFSGIALVLSSCYGFAQSGDIEETIVTSCRRQQTLQETSLSITAFSDNAIERLGFRQSTDVSMQIPNLTIANVSGDAGIPAIFVRGAGLAFGEVFAVSPVAQYRDDVYIAQAAAQIFPIFDLQRVEVHRGPQGTRYGINSTAGAMHFISRKPGNEWQAQLRAEAAAYGYSRFEGAAGGPVTDWLGLRVAVTRADSDGWLHNRFIGNKQNGIDVSAWRAQFRVNATRTLNVLLKLHGVKNRSDNTKFRHRGVLDGFGDVCPVEDILAGRCADLLGYSEYSAGVLPLGVTYAATPGYKEGNYNVEGRNDSELLGSLLRFDWQLGNATVQSITALSTLDDFRPQDLDSGPFGLNEQQFGVKQSTWSQEFRISQQRNAWDWLVGAFVLGDMAKNRGNAVILSDGRALFVGVDDPAQCADASGIGPPPGNPTGFCPRRNVQTTGRRTEQSISSQALFLDLGVNLNTSLVLHLGLRYTNEEVRHKTRFIYLEPLIGNPLIFAGDNTRGFDNVSGRAVLDWRLNERLLLYGGVTTGFKAGGFQSAEDRIGQFDPEELIDYEFGFKSTSPSGRVQLNGSLFVYDYSDAQVFTIFSEPPEFSPSLGNAADAETFGGELELQWAPFDTTYLSLGLGYLHAKYEKYIDPSIGEDLSGNKMIVSPELTLNGRLYQEIPLGDVGKLSFLVDFNYQDEVYFSATNNPALKQGDYCLWNARVGWASPDERWELAAWGRNLFDRQYLTYVLDLTPLGLYREMLGAPRTFGLELSYRL